MHGKLILLMIIICFCSLITIAQGKSLELIGTVVGKERHFGHIYNANEINKKLLIVRVEEKIKGDTGSKIILVNFDWRLSDKKTPYDGTIATRWNFRLSRDKNCDSNLEKLQFAYFGIDKKITGIFPQFDRTSGIDFVDMPFDTVFPCYSLKTKNYSEIKLSEIDLAKIPRKDTELFILKENLFRNISQTPLEISIFQNGLFAFTNTSAKIIVDYTLGCVSAEIDENVLKFETVSGISLLPKSSLLTPKGSGGADYYYSNQLKTCYDKKSKFSVVQVKFKDGTIWKVN